MDEKTKLLSEHIRTRISHTQPHAVVCVIAFCNMSKAITRLPHESPSISIPVVWFVQSHQCTAYMMRNWLQEAWEPLPGGLADSPQFLDFSQRAASLESSWFRLGIFGALGLNNRARADARTERKVLRPLPALARSRLRLVPRCSRDRISPLSQRLATATRLEDRARKKAARQAPRAAGDENADPQLRPGRAGARPPQAPSSVPGPTETSTQPDRVPKAPPPTKRPRAPPILQTLASAERKEVRPRKKAAGRDCAAAPPAAAPARAPVCGNTPTSRLVAAPGAASPAATAAAGTNWKTRIHSFNRGVRRDLSRLPGRRQRRRQRRGSAPPAKRALPPRHRRRLRRVLRSAATLQHRP